MVTLKPYHYRRRYADWRDPPSQCDNCQEPLVTITNNHVVYGKNFGEWPMIYLCMSCGAFCGCHPFSVFPLGLMANDETRALRRSLHAMIDPLWKSGGWSRNEVYWLMAGLMGFTQERRFHIGELSYEECLQANAAFRSWETAADFSVNA